MKKCAGLENGLGSSLSKVGVYPSAICLHYLLGEPHLVWLRLPGILAWLGV